VINVRVRLYANLTQNIPSLQGLRAGTPIEVDIPQGSSLSDLLERLQLPSEQIKVAFVNGRAQHLDYRLAPGDEVGLFPPIGGG